MNSDNQEVFNCEDHGEERFYCNICGKMCLVRFHKNHLQSQSYY